MSNVSNVPAIIPPGFDPTMASRLAALDPNWKPGAGEMSANVRASYAVIRYKGKIWSIVFGGEEHRVEREMSPGYREPSPSLEVVVIRANPAVSKRFYKDKWVDGSAEAPDCKSIDGVRPDAGVKNKQSDLCASCPQNAWGSKITEQGKQAKACADGRRMAIAPLADIDNEAFGGPMLLTLPPASLQAAVAIERQLAQVGYPPYAVAMRLTFDPAEPYPSLVFSAIRALEEHEFTKVMKLREDPRTKVILFDTVVDQPAQPALPAPGAVFEQPPASPPPVQAAIPAPAAPAAPVPAEPAWQFSPDGKHRWRPGMAAWEPVPAPVHVVHPPAPPPAPVVVAPPPAPPSAPGVVALGLPTPTPPAPVEPAWQFSPDGKHRWRPGMAAWEPVPAPVVDTPAAPTLVMPAAPPPQPAPEAPPAVAATVGGGDLDAKLNELLGGAAG